MGRTKGAKDLANPKCEALIELRKQCHTSNCQLSSIYKCDEKTVQNTCKKAAQAEKENIDPLSTEAFQRRPQSGQPSVISLCAQRSLIRHATKNRYQRRKSWVTVAREIEIMASATAIANAFNRAGYGRYPPKHKPPLTLQMKIDRLNFIIEWLEKLRGKEDQICYTDETAIRVGEVRGQQWVTRIKKETWHKDCIDVQYKGYTEMMF